MACSASPPDLAADRATLPRLPAAQRTADLERRATLLTGSFADTCCSFSGGRVATPAHDASTQRSQASLDQSTFRARDDPAPPVIRIAPDARVAYAIVQKRVGLTADTTTAQGPDTM